MRLCARLLTSSNIILRFKVRGAHIRSIDLRRPRGGPSPFLERSVRLRGAAVHGDILSIWVDDDCRPIVTAIPWLHRRRSGTPWQRCLVPAAAADDDDAADAAAAALVKSPGHLCAVHPTVCRSERSSQ